MRKTQDLILVFLIMKFLLLKIKICLLRQFNQHPAAHAKLYHLGVPQLEEEIPTGVNKEMKEKVEELER